MSSAPGFVHKSKRARVRFELTLRIHDLNNVPLVTGTSFIKWHLPSSSAAEHRGRTAKAPIRDHRVHYDYEKHVAVRLSVGKDGILEECLIHFEVEQEYSSGGRGERITLGEIHLNLAEYADQSMESLDSQASSNSGGGYNTAPGEEGTITRRYLMQESKINSTLKIGIRMRHTEGTRDYYAPPLRMAPVFGGIAGIISSSDANNSTPHAIGAGGAHTPNTDDGGPSAAENFSLNNREVGEMQDMYRRTLAAFWTSQPGELRADECIEDIFSGGDGWGKNGRPVTPARSLPESGDSTPNAGDGGGGISRDNSSAGKPDGEGGSRHKHKFSSSSHHLRHRRDKSLRKMPGELDEMDVREDLVSWRIGHYAKG